MGSFDFFADRDAIYARKDLSPLEKHLAVVILSFRNADTGQCNPPIKSDFIKEDGSKVEDIVDRSGMSERAIQNNLNSLEKKAVLLRTRRWNAASDITFTLSPQEMHPAGDAPRTTCTLTPQEMHPQSAGDAPRRKCTPHQMHPHPAGDAPSPRTRCGLTDKEQIKNREEISSAHTCEEPPFDDDLFDEAARVASEAASESEATSETVVLADDYSIDENISKRLAMESKVKSDIKALADAQCGVTSDFEACSKPTQPRKERTPRVRFPECIPDDWRVDAQKLRPEIDAQATFTKMRCWLGANNTTTKTVRQWKTQFLGWIGREKKGFGHYAGNHRSDRSRQGYAGFGARNTAEIDYNYGLPVRGAVG
ncbi:helix-turn-helix domain-containing protein [Sutterella wadsworthensis]|uniref:helix-turn-helix domain-containing protein n=1 Tax=Sutterella wadsworthensis TaxID=40545 RepID=UPI00402A6073